MSGGRASTNQTFFAGEVHNVSTQQGCCLLEPWISPTIPSTLELYGKKLHVNLRTYVGRTSLVFLRKLRRSFAEK